MTWQMFVGEMIGTAILLLIGNGVVANVLYKKTGGSKGGAFMIAFGWGIAVLAGVMVAQAIGAPAQLNPAVTMGMAVQGALGTGSSAVAQFFGLIGGQIVGAIIGQLMVTAMYWKHSIEEDAETIRWTHCTDTTQPKSYLSSLFAEFSGTLVLVGTVLVIFVVGKQHGTVSPYIGGLLVALVVTGIGVSHGVTGWAINPVRDLVPRIMYQFTPYKNKTNANWKYAWVPVLGPLMAGALAGAFARLA
ncbi:MIP/aquaporin family protein [Mycoplasma todarodis]|uniref:Aquaporin family protein n=1 Tax=Mycoplasma todarodis TaxID=1937191 RepID=A0A4R0XJZ6_9MOLU|nr:MIP/aquaporin family protein [Mycoplasma todarodis]TCG10774.1 aquaporin family protein [Mycoplasma todarodis]